MAERMHMAGHGQLVHAMPAWVAYVCSHVAGREVAGSFLFLREHRLATCYVGALVGSKDPMGREPDKSPLKRNARHASPSMPPHRAPRPRRVPERGGHG